MVWIVAIAALAQGPGLFGQVVPTPTGKNGFEEYLRAAERVDDAPFRQWLAFDAPVMGSRISPPAGLRGDSSVLERSRWVLNRYGNVLELLRQGNAKPVFEPRSEIKIETRFPEYRSMRALARAMVVASYAEFAAGQTAQGTDRLLQSLIMGQNVASLGMPAAHGNGMVQSRAVFDAFDARLGQISLEDCRKVERTANDLLQRPPTTAKIFEEGGAWVRRTLAVVLADPRLAKEAIEPPLGDAIASLSSADLKRFQQAVDRNISDRYDPLVRNFRQLESEWVFPGETQNVFRKGGDVEDMARAFVDEFGASYRGTVVISAAARTQLRLLRLHAQIRAFRWEHDRWPARLEDISAEVIDPLSGIRFDYKVNEIGYTLSSRGRPETGPIMLRSSSTSGRAAPIDP